MKNIRQIAKVFMIILAVVFAVGSGYFFYPFRASLNSKFIRWDKLLQSCVSLFWCIFLIAKTKRMEKNEKSS